MTNMNARVKEIMQRELEKSYKKIEESKDTKVIVEELEYIQYLRNELEDLENTKKPKWYEKIDVNLLISSGVSLASILLILNYEKTEVITSKSLSIAQKLIGK